MKDLLSKLEGRGKDVLGRYAPMLLVVALGIALMALPAGERPQERPAQGKEEAFSLEDFQHQLAQVLSQVKGAGPVEVLLSVDGGSRQVLAYDLRREEGRSEQDVVTLGRGTGEQQVVPLQTVAPSFRGAVVVCPGGGDPQVRLELLRAVSALTGLGTDRICICQSKG